jgi:ABC-type glycerol-3-phosphate transport system substrate-binding protein
MMRRTLVHLLPFVLVFYACQPAVPGTPSLSTAIPPSKTPAPGKTPAAVSRLGVREAALDGITLDVWHAWYGAPAALFESQVDEFNQSNPWGILARVEGFQNYTELYAEASAAVHGPNRPDVVVGLPEYAVEWHAQKAVVDLSNYVSDPKYGLSAADVADFPSVFWEQDRLGPLRLGIPAQRTTRLLLYNQTWAQELGFPNPPRDAQEFEQQACAANQSFSSDDDPQNDGNGGWLIDTHPISDLSWLLAFGGGALQSEGLRFLTPENIAATRFVKGLSESGCAWQTRETPATEIFVERKALFITAGLEDLPELARDFAGAGNGDTWTVLPFPGSEGNALVVYGSSYILFESDRAEQLAAWLLVRWFLEPDNQAEWVHSAGLFPLQVSTMGQLADYASGHPQWAEAVNLLPQAHTTPQLAAWRIVRVALGDGFTFMFRVDTPVGQVPAILAQLDTLVTELNQEQ